MVGKNQRKSDLIQWLLSTVIIVVAAVLLSLGYFKIDLTEEKRHTLTNSTEEMLTELDDKMFVRVYLKGTYPAKWKNLEQSIRERLDEFRDLSSNVEYEFIDIYESGDKTTIGENEAALWEKGLRFTNIYNEDKGTGSKQVQNIWPAALISYKEKVLPLQFYKSDNPDPTDAVINTSINNLEYELSSKMRELMRREKPSIVFLEGHGELEPIETADWTRTLQETYDVTTIRVNDQVNSLTDKLDNTKYRTPKYDLLVIAKPDSLFGQKEKLLIDQYIMSGGKTLWMIDPIKTDLDSLSQQQQTLAMTNDIGIYDMLFDYGVKANRDLVLDYQCDIIVLDAGRDGTQRNFQPFNWYFAPLTFTNEALHPISANLDPVRFDFVSSLEIVGNSPDVTKTPILKSSEMSRIQKAPVRVNTAVVNFDINHFQGSKTNLRNLAVLLEGEFDSNFKGRLNDSLTNSPDFAFREKSATTKMIVIGDGDVGRNKVMPVENGFQPLPL
ncbi:MAG: gliding motility-associated ABC transporter substrate-binding protein GldG, partial [Flavobacteriales bacterium]